MKPDDPFYINRPADRLVADRAELTGETLVIKAPRQMGKTSLLNRYLHKCDGADKRWALVDFQCFTNDELENYSIFLGQLASALARSLGIDEGCVPEFASQQQFNFFVEDHLIRSAGDPIVLAFDEVDRVLGRAYQQDFFSMLRVWHNSRSRPRSRWEDVDLVLVIATEPYLLINRGDQSPFNVTPAIELGPFPLSALEELNVRYGGILNSAEIERVFELLGGHPYLTQLAFYRLHASTGMAFDQLMEHAVAPDGPFGEHLRRLLLLLQEQSGLMAALRQVIAKGTVSSEDHYHRLHGAGLVLRKKERVVPSNLLYARFFRGIR
jgi:hypothetical protein